jgi:hypothetical protein
MNLSLRRVAARTRGTDTGLIGCGCDPSSELSEQAPTVPISDSRRDVRFCAVFGDLRFPKWLGALVHAIAS